MDLEETLNLLPPFIWPTKIKRHCSECNRFIKIESGCAYLGICKSGNGWGIDYHTVERDWQIFERAETMKEAAEKIMKKLKKDKLLPKK